MIRGLPFSTTTIAAAVVVSLVAGAAYAQELSVRAEGDDAGIALSDDGRSRIHFGADAGIGFDTNPYTTPLATGDFTGDGVARIRPYVEAVMPGALLSARARTALDYGLLPGVVNPETRAFLLYQASATGDVEVNRGGALSFAVGDSVSVNTDPGIVALGTLLSRVNNQARIGVGFVPGGGTLKLRLGVTNSLLHYFPDETTESPILSGGVLDSLSTNVNLRADYRFLPKTGAFASATAGWYLFPFSTRDLPQAFPVSLRLGVQGQVQTKLSGLLALGYENPLVYNSRGLQSGNIVGLVGQSEVQWAPFPTTGLAAGYVRRFDPIALYQYLGQNKTYLRASQLFGVTQVSANVAWSVLQYGAEDTGSAACLETNLEDCAQLTDKVTGRVDHAIVAGVSAVYHVMPWLTLGVSNNIDWRITNASTIAAEGSPSIDLSYVRNETLLTASARY